MSCFLVINDGHWATGSTKEEARRNANRGIARPGKVSLYEVANCEPDEIKGEGTGFISFTIPPLATAISP